MRRDIHAYEIHAYEIHAYEIDAYEIHAYINLISIVSVKRDQTHVFFRFRSF